MNKRFVLACTLFCSAMTVYGETNMAELEKLVAAGKAEKVAPEAYTLPEKVVINGKEHPKTEFGALYSSSNVEYFLLTDLNRGGLGRYLAKLFDSKGNVIWDLENPGDVSTALISDKGLVALFHGDINTSVVEIINKNGERIKTLQAGDIIQGDTIENLYEYDAQFAKNSEILFVLTYFTNQQLALLGINDTGDVIYLERVAVPSMQNIGDWFARVYFNPRRGQLLIDSSGIGAAPPMLSCWSIPQKLISARKTEESEVIYNASFADNDDILLLVKKKGGIKAIRRLSQKGKFKAEKSEIKKMDDQERKLINEKPIKVRSLNWGRE